MCGVAMGSSVLEEWCSQVEILLHENDIDKSSGESHVPNNTALLGPRTEVAWWMKRAAKLGKQRKQHAFYSLGMIPTLATKLL